MNAKILDTKCGCQIIKDSRDHDECRCDDDGENCICADCYNGEYEEEEEEEEDPKTKPCSCGCDVIGGSCEKGLAIDNGEDDEEEEIQPHCYKCFNMNMNLNVNCFVCDKIYCKSHSYCILGDDDMPYCSKKCFLDC